ncbi:hypothetical protein UUU_22940 [Klebsiella pneumoniae subsp. pneumoniae DSM 30104 = JCM 1662 = NBRC 14940]|nr:hypothetical protein UUU_22940 [Klebsiella pneumoniae subsp. pneumoniae DSM 30104 = JCM 1662 = NBRC 14940]
MLAAKQNRSVQQSIKLINRLTIEKTRRQRRNGLIAVIDLRELFRMHRQHG